MNEIVNDKVACVVDSGMFMWLAEVLARDFETVYLYVHWHSDYPQQKDAMIGTGIPNVIRVKEFWPYFDKIDIFIFPGLYEGGLQNYLASVGKKVWGARNGDEFERERWKAHEFYKSIDIPVPEVQKVNSFNRLDEELKQQEDRYVKISEYRGDGETFHHQDYQLSEQQLSDWRHHLGKGGSKYEFLIEKPIRRDDIVEAGFDPYVIDGKYPENILFGYEVKDESYVAVTKKSSELPEFITDFHRKMADELAKHQYRQFLSTEIRVGEDKVPTVIDTTTRFASPPSELYSLMALNFAEIIWYGASGVLVEPIFEFEYGVEVFIYSQMAEDEWMPVRYPKEVAQYVRLRNYCIIDGVYYVIPRYPSYDHIGVIVVGGKSLKECFKKVDEIKEQIQGQKLDIHNGSLDKAMEVIKKGEHIGLDFKPVTT